ncbi:MAG: hypothetical protein Q9190_000203 [Brigantiaea leucoxantha]
MSADSLALTRKNVGEDIRKLAEEHLQHDLTNSDRETLESAASKVGTHITIGSLIGLGLGVFLAFRIRSSRTKMFNAFRTVEKPTHVKFADGREEAIPDISPLMKPSTLGDVATYFFFSAGGVFLGGETGLLTGSGSASRTITKDPETRARIESAFRRFRADVLRKEADAIDDKRSLSDMLGF